MSRRVPGARGVSWRYTDVWFSGGPGAGEAVGRKVSGGRADVKRGGGPRHSLEEVHA